MKLVTSKEIKALDQYSINTIGIPATSLMELAGSGCAKAIMERWPVKDTTILVVCGKGNNGGDGMVVARHLHNHGADVSIMLVGNENSIKGHAAINLKSAKALKIPTIEINSTADIMYLEEMFHTSDIIVDAIFGVGLSRNVTGIAREMVSAINSTPAIKVAVDIPTGLCSDSGKIMGEDAIQTDLTVTFGYGKVGQFTSPGFEYCGEIEIVDISLPPIDHGESNCFLLTDSWVRSHLPKRPLKGHKGTFGHVMIIAGSKGKAGAAIMSSEAAITMGSGLVTVTSPENILDILMNRLTEAMCEPLCSNGEEPSSEEVSNLVDLATKRSAIIIGPGIPNNPGTKLLLEKLITENETPLVIDAEALNILSENISILKKSICPIILTPHPGEMERLSKVSKEEFQDNRHSYAIEFAKAHNIFLVLKGARTIIASPTGRVAINPTGNPGMATGGSGDILTGIIGSLLAQKLDPFTAAAVGTFIHGRAGDLGAQEKGESSLRAMDIVTFMPTAFYSLNSKNIQRYPQLPDTV